jgi:AcrR family transcriptional regulator
MSRPLRTPRADNRQARLLAEAARLFGSQGFQSTSVRDIVRAVDMLPGSLYYHFARKEDLLAAVYAEGVRRISERVEVAVAAQADPWAPRGRLRRAPGRSARGRRLRAGRDPRAPTTSRRSRPSSSHCATVERLFVDLVAGLPRARPRSPEPSPPLLGALN